jgi:hypothetical protein
MVIVWITGWCSPDMVRRQRLGGDHQRSHAAHRSRSFPRSNRTHADFLPRTKRREARAGYPRQRLTAVRGAVAGR